MQTFYRDIRYSLRALRTSRGFAIAVVVMLAVSVAMNGTVLTLVDTLIFSRPIGVREPERVLRTPNAWLRRPDQYNSLGHSLQTITVAAQSPLTELSFGGTPEAELIQARYVTPNYFTALGVQPLAGQWFSATEGSGVSNAAVVGHELWRTRFGSDPNIAGRSIPVDGQFYSVVGIAPAGFTGVDPATVDVWLPAEAAPRSSDGFWLGGGFEIVGRVAKGFSLEHAAAELRTKYPADVLIVAKRADTTAHVEVMPVAESAAARFVRLNRLLLCLVAAGWVLLLIACANVSGLLVNRTLQRSREIAVRMQLGASRGRILREVMTEILLLNLVAGLVALVLIYWSIPLFRHSLISPIPGLRVYSFFPDAVYGLDVQNYSSALSLRILAVTGFFIVLATCLSGLAPALQIRKADLNKWLTSTGAVHPAHTRLRTGLVVLQVALTTTLLVSAGLFVRSLQNALNVNVGLNIENVLIASVDPGPAENTAATLRVIADHARTLSPVSNVAQCWSPPIGQRGKLHMALEIPGYEWPWGMGKAAGNAQAFVEAVSPEYFSLLGMRVLQGRGLSETDILGAPLVVVIDDRLGRDVFRGESPLGKCVQFAYDGAAPDRLFQRLCRQIVGVVSSIRVEIVRIPGVDEGEYDPAFYVPAAQWGHSRHILIRARTDPRPYVSAIRAELGRADPQGRYVKLEPLSLYHDQQTHAWRAASGLFGAFGLIAFVLATVGTYSLLAFVVKQRRQEIGIRLALGATRGRIARTTLARGMGPVLIGLVFGVAGSVLLAQLVAALLFGVAPADPITIVGVALGTIVVAWLACIIPTRAAVRVDPAVSLRYE